MAFLDGVSSIYRTEGMKGLWKGTSLALFGVTNGALQFMTYEKMKQMGFNRKKAQFAKAGKTYTAMDDRLVCNTHYHAMPFSLLRISQTLRIHSYQERPKSWRWWLLTLIRWFVLESRRVSHTID